jgi:hypothetical protein
VHTFPLPFSSESRFIQEQLFEQLIGYIFFNKKSGLKINFFGGNSKKIRSLVLLLVLIESEYKNADSMSKKLLSLRSQSKKKKKAKKKSVGRQNESPSIKPLFLINFWGLKAESDAPSDQHYKYFLTFLIFLLILAGLLYFLIPYIALGGIAMSTVLQIISLFKNRSP